MARPSKNTVDYFPHMCHHGKTLSILESRYGNDGYAFWFKLLEELGVHDDHYLDLRNDYEIEALAAKCRMETAMVIEILDLLARIGTIDGGLWGDRIVWVDNFIAGVKDAYKKRNGGNPPSKPTIGSNGVSVVVNPPQSEFPEPETLENDPIRHRKPGKGKGKGEGEGEGNEREIISSSIEEEATPSFSENLEILEPIPPEPTDSKNEEPESHGNSEVNAALMAIREITGLPPGGRKIRIHTMNLLRAFRKEFPDRDPVDAYRGLVQAAVSLGGYFSGWAAKPDDLFYNWQKIAIGVKARDGPTQLKILNPIADLR